MAVLNGTPLGPGFFIFFNNLDTSQGFRGFKRVEVFEEETDEEILEIITVILASRIME
jgi:hypothetical protein